MTITIRRSPSIGRLRAAAAMSIGVAAGLSRIEALDGKGPIALVDRRLDRVDDPLDQPDVLADEQMHVVRAFWP